MAHDTVGDEGKLLMDMEMDVEQESKLETDLLANILINVQFNYTNLEEESKQNKYRTNNN